MSSFDQSPRDAWLWWARRLTEWLARVLAGAVCVFARILAALVTTLFHLLLRHLWADAVLFVILAYTGFVLVTVLVQTLEDALLSIVQSVSLRAAAPVSLALLLLAFVVMLMLRNRRTGEVVEDTSHGSARWGRNRELALADNAVPQLLTDRVTLGWSAEPIQMRKNQGAALAFTDRKWYGVSRSYFHPLVVTGRKLPDSEARPDEGHIITIAGSGAGKGMAAVKPNLMLYEGSVVVLDPKGENFLATVRSRQLLGQRVCLVDPFGLAPPEMRERFLVRFNPLATLEERYLAGDHSEVFDEAGAIADMMVLTTNKDNQPHWNDKAKSFLKAAILFVTYADVYQDRTKYPLTLNTVKECILNFFSTPESIQDFIKQCRAHPHLTLLAGEVSMIANEERSSVLSHVLEHTEFLNSPNVRESLSASDFTIHDLKNVRMSVYLILPANRLKAYSRLARLWIGSLLQEMMRDTAPPRWRVLFFLDEMAQLGAMDTLRDAVSLARGYGVDLWMLFQDIPQIKGAYGDSWQTFLANAKIQQFFGVRDLETAEWVSKRLGQSTIDLQSVSQSQSVTSDNNFSSRDSNSKSVSKSTTVQATGRALMQADEVMRLPDNEEILFIGEQFPVRAYKFDLRVPRIELALAKVHARQEAT